MSVALDLIALFRDSLKGSLTVTAELVVLGEILGSVLVILKEAGRVAFDICVAKVVKLVA